jgi:DedD protein
MPDPNNSPADFNPRHRIVGAVVLVVLAIIVLPMVLDEEQLETQKPGNEIILSEEDSKIYVSKAKDIRSAHKMKVEPGTASPGEANNQQQKKKITKEEVKIPPAPEKKIVEAVKKPATKTSKDQKIVKKSQPAQKITKGWVVQIGTYSDPANAKKVRATLVRRGYHVRMEKIRLSRGSATRVRVGPFSDRGKAITTLSHIGRDVGLQGVVLRYP